MLCNFPTALQQGRYLRTHKPTHLSTHTQIIHDSCLKSLIFDCHKSLIICASLKIYLPAWQGHAPSFCPSQTFLLHMLRYSLFLKHLRVLSPKHTIGLFAWIIILNNCFLICTSVLSKLHKITNADNKYVLHFMLSMHAQQVKFFGMIDTQASSYTHAHGNKWRNVVFVMAVWQYMNIRYYSPIIILIYSLPAKCVFLIAASKPSAIWKHNRTSQKHTQWQSEVQFCRNNRFVEKTMNNSLFLLKTYMGLQNAQESGVSYQRWQFVQLYFLQGR